MEEVRKFVQENWNVKHMLLTLIGKPCQSDMEWNFGSVPTEKASVETQNGVIVRVKTWSGLKWSARGGYGSPTVIAE